MGDATPYAETDELRALREQIRRDEEALAAIEAALAQIPQSVRDQVAIAAQRKEKYGLVEFVAYMRSWMTARNLFNGVHIAYWLYGLYYSKYAEAHPDESSGPSWGSGGGGGWAFAPLMAPAAPGGSVVDAVFAKARQEPSEKRA